jgi:LEA14-like dessication related protein
VTPGAKFESRKEICMRSPGFGRAARLALVATGALLLASCGVLGPKFETPQLDVVGLELLDSGFFQQSVKVRMKVRNPNARALPVKGVNADLELAGEKFASGVSGDQFTVPAFGESEFDMVVSGNMAGALLRVLSSRKERKEIEYRLQGKVNLAEGILRSIPFNETGRVPLQ